MKRAGIVVTIAGGGHDAIFTTGCIGFRGNSKRKHHVRVQGVVESETQTDASFSSSDKSGPPISYLPAHSASGCAGSIREGCPRSNLSGMCPVCAPGYPPPSPLIPHSKGLTGMGLGLSRQTKDLVPSSRKTKDLGRPEADSYQSSVVSCQKNAKPKTSRIPALPSIVTNSRGPTRQFREIYFWLGMRTLQGFRGFWAIDNFWTPQVQMPERESDFYRPPS